MLALDLLQVVLVHVCFFRLDRGESTRDVLSLFNKPRQIVCHCKYCSSGDFRDCRGAVSLNDCSLLKPLSINNVTAILY
ncbi:hypothetical protein KC19_2G157300 [Ceratodon purpureus]|uniref:Secreted protein n=1 Tax=Ceratodon purpureus TaxID=3225 RepID=A0A8T0IX10_CERPU|nr:hypothetical protein KC19_2G157300 [Ceratodon purpureus]